jgi:excinuclease ABC subunit B
VILYADTVTDAMRRMIETTATRRATQEAYNAAHGIEPQSVKRAIHGQLATEAYGREVEQAVAETPERYDVLEMLAELEREMLTAAEAMEFERAAAIRDEIKELRRGVGKGECVGV